MAAKLEVVHGERHAGVADFFGYGFFPPELIPAIRDAVNSRRD